MSEVLFRNRLVKLRKELNKTQEEMARVLNVERTTYGGYERGQMMPPYEKLSKLASYFNVSVDYLMGLSNSKTNEIQPTTPEIHDVSSVLNLLLEELKDNTIALKVDGYDLDDESRRLLIASVENSIAMSKIIAERNKKG